VVLDRVIVRRVGWAVAALAILAAIGIAGARPLAYDLVAYTGAALRLLAGETLYPLAARVPISFGPGDYLYHPATAVLFIPLALVPADAARVVWTAALVVLAALLGHRLIAPLRPDLRPWAVAGYALYLPLIAEITLGNLNLVTLALCLLAWHQRARPVAAGAALAFAVGLKLLPVALPLFFLAAGAWRMTLWAAAVGGAALAATVVLMPDEWARYVGVAPTIASTPAVSVIPVAPTGPVAQVALLVAALGVTIAMGRLARDRGRADLAYAVALAAVPLPAPAINYPYLVFTLPLLAMLLRTPGWWWAGAAVAWVAIQVPARPDAPGVAFGGLLLLISVGAAAAMLRPSTVGGTTTVRTLATG
jgi:hypothetical protein